MPAFRSAWIATCLVLSSANPFLQAQVNPTQDANVDQIETIRQGALASTELDSETKQLIDSTCVLALEGLTRIREIEGTAAVLTEASLLVDKQAAELREQLTELQLSDPNPPTLTDLAALEQEVGRRELELTNLKSAHTASGDERLKRIARRREIRDSLLGATDRIKAIQTEIDELSTSGEATLLAQARRIEMRVRQMVIQAEQPALMSELAKYDTEDVAEISRLKRDIREEVIRLRTGELQVLQERLVRRRAADKTAALRRAEATLRSTSHELREWAEQNVEFANAALLLSQPLIVDERNLEKSKSSLEELRKQFSSTTKRVDEIGLTGSIGALLRRQLSELPDTRHLRRALRDRKTKIEDAQYALFDYDELRSESSDELLQKMLTEVRVQDTEEREALETEARSLIEARREYLDLVIKTHDQYLDTLFELDATEQKTIQEASHYREYIDERVFWIQSNRPLWVSFQIDESDQWALDKDRWLEVASNYAKDIRTSPAIHAMVFLCFSLLLWQKRRCRQELETISQLASRSTCIALRPTFRALFLTFLLSVIWPGLIFVIGWRLNYAANGSAFSRAIAQALLATSAFYFPFEFLRRICRPHGLADSHFDWSTTTIAVVRTTLRWAIPTGCCIVFATTLLYSSETEHEVDSLERICFVFGMGVLSLAVFQLLNPDAGLLTEYLRSHPSGWIGRLKPIWFWGSTLAPLALATMTVVGFYYTAQQLNSRLYDTLMLFGAVQLIGAILRRVLLVHRRVISMTQARERHAAKAANQNAVTDGTRSSPSQLVDPEELQTDVATITQQSKRLIRMAVMTASVAGTWLIWSDTLPALRFLDETPVIGQVATVASNTNSEEGQILPIGSTQMVTTDGSSADPNALLSGITVADIGLAILIACVTVVCARNIPGLMEMIILQRLPLDNSIRYALTSLTSYAIVLLGIIMAFNVMSIGWSKVQWLATALTFGLAFGLQEIFANFVAGLILLFERPIRVGDVVTVDEVTGVVSRIRIRATTITNWDRKEYVIPNKEFITGRMLNWTLSDKTNRILINIGIAYGSDVDQAKELLRTTCQKHPLVLDDPPTSVTFEGFGDNSLNLVVRTFLPDLDNRLPVIDELHTTIDKAFRRANIEIAFPQRDLHLKSIDQSFANRILENQDKKDAA